jgi:hypothetical protein
MAQKATSKPVSNPAATGSGGTAFETKVAAACLTLLLTRGAPLFLGTGTLRTVHLQAGHLGVGWCTDDLLLEATDASGGLMKAALQVKRGFTLSAKDSECVQTLRGALTDFRNSAQFDQQHDVVALVTSSLSAKLVRGLRTLLDCARASIDAADMRRRLAIPGYLGKPALEYHTAIGEILADAEGGAPSDEELWHFLRRFHVVDLDLNVERGFTETMLRTLLAATLPDHDASAADATWHELVATSLGDAGRATSYTRETLPPALLQRHGRATEFSRGVARLLEDSAVVTSGIRTTIAEKTTIQRHELSGKLCRLLESSPLVFVTGAAGSGKSVLVKSAFSVATQGGVGFAFRADTLAGGHINDVLSQRGITLRDLRTQTAMHGKKVLWVDSLERLMEKPPEKRAAFLDLLHAMKDDPTWRLVVTCRDYSAETVRTAFFVEVGLTPEDIDVGELSDNELEAVAAEFPPLDRPLSNSSLRTLLRNPFFLDKAAQMNWMGTDPLPATERAFREKVWNEVIRRVDEDVEIGLPNLRGQALVEVALRRAKALEPFIAAPDVDPRALTRLVRDSLLQTPILGSIFYAPAHDVFEDWALMQWLDDAFVRHSRQLAPLLAELGTYPALRRAYRRWLTESLDVAPEATDTLVAALIQNPSVAAHWREDTLVGVLQSSGARDFIFRNSSLLLENNAKLLRLVIHILRVACRAAIPWRKFGLDAAGNFFLPKGNGWIGAGELMEVAIPQFTDADLMLIIGFLEDWVLFTRYGLKYPIGASSVAKVAWHWLPKIPWRCPVRDADERLIKIILAIPRADETTLTEKIGKILTGESDDNSDRNFLELIFNHFACGAIVRDLPELAFRVAEHLLGLDQTLEKVIARDRNSYQDRQTAHAFGFGKRDLTDDFPASALHGPYLQMLWHHPSRGLDFIIRMVNRAGEAYSHPGNRFGHVEPPEIVKVYLTDCQHEQHANWRLWAAYRGNQGAPHCFESVLMALEHWLLEKVKRKDSDLEPTLMDLLRRSNNVAIAAVVASIAAANTALAGEAAFALLTCRSLLKYDLERSTGEVFSTLHMGGFGLTTRGEQRQYYKERQDSARLEHRHRNLEYVADQLQRQERFRRRVWSLIDAYKQDLPPESEQDQETRLWRLQLYRIDRRNIIETGRTEEGHILFGSRELEPDLQALVDSHKPSSAAFDVSIALLNWGRSAFEGKIAGDDWQEQITKAKVRIETKTLDEGARDFGAGGPAYIAAVCIRDHWAEMSVDQQEWCAHCVCEAVVADADVDDHLTIGARNALEGSRAGAFAISALFDKALSPATQERLLPVLSIAVVHAVEQTVSFAVLGIAQFLWKSDRALALTCLQALVTQALEDYAFVERQRQSAYWESESDSTFHITLRSRMRELVVNREAGNEDQIIALDLARWPGRTVARHLFTIAAQNQDDPFIRQIMQQCAVTLPAIWEANQRPRKDERYDPQIEHDFVDALCRFALKLDPSEACQLLGTVFEAAQRFPERAASIVTWLIIYQADRVPAPTMWQLWQRFADDFSANANAKKVDAEHSHEAKMLRELFLGGNWAEQRDWLPLHGETHRLSAFFLRLPPTVQGFECYAYYLAKAGTPTLPDALIDVATKLAESAGASILNENAVFCLEEVLTRMIYGGNIRIRTDGALRQATLTVLDALVAAGSSAAYKLRDDYLTPVA